MKIILIILAGFEIFDGFLTHLLVGNGMVREGNKLIETIVYEGNFLLLKIIGAFISIMALWYVYRRFPQVALATASCIVVFYSAVLLWNINIIL
jgi:uncharacterized membrane protein